jgi:hypothetical protein
VKIGYGVVNPSGACAAAADPIALALLATRPVPDLEGPSRAFTLAQAWRDEVERAAGEGTAAARDYLRVAHRLTRLFLTAMPVREALCWLARHVRALAEAAQPELWKGQHHGALVERVRHAIDTTWDALATGEDETVARLEALDAAIAAPDGAAAVATVLARIICPAVMATDGGQGRPRSLALSSDAVGDRRRRRGPRRADGGGEPERLPFARPDVPRSLHRSPR